MEEEKEINFGIKNNFLSQFCVKFLGLGIIHLWPPPGGLKTGRDSWLVTKTVKLLRDVTYNT